MTTDRARLCLALDVERAALALDLVDELHDIVDVMKIGLELFVAEGPALVRAVRARGVDVFLDLKLHDIPQTVAMAVARARDLDVRFLTVHASGGPRMLEAAVGTADGVSILAVTALTSLTDADLAAVGSAFDAGALVSRLARLADASGCAGVVCSPHEVGLVRDAAPRLVRVTPGIRGAGDDKGDQARTMSPAEAVAAGADLLVVGRPVRGAPDRRAAATAIAAQLRRPRAG